MVAVPSAGASRPNAAPSSNGNTPIARIKPTNGAIPRAVVPLSARKSQTLDMNTVELKGKPLGGFVEPDSRPHIGDIQEAPTFRPTVEQWKNPLSYLKSIEAEGKKYGIVKIVPPETWNPEFCIDTERFHFKTRKQELNAVEGTSRMNLNYLDQLQRYHKQHGRTLTRFPSVDKRPLDLYELKKAVERRGGFEQVCKGKKWAEIGRDLGYSGKIMSSLSTSLKNSYHKWLHPYEQWVRGVKPSVHALFEQERGGPYGTPSPAASPLKKATPQTPSALSQVQNSPAVRASQALNASMSGDANMATPEMHQPIPMMSSGFTAVNAPSWTAANVPAYSPMEVQKRESPTAPENNGQYDPMESSPQNGTSHKRQLSSEGENDEQQDDENARRSKRLKAGGPPTMTGSNMTQPRSKPLSAREKSHLPPGDYCETCGRSDDDPRILLCDGCFSGYHTYCLEPPLKDVPENDWHCAKCLVGSGEFGFEEGGIYSLRQFQERARLFKEHHFQGKTAVDPATNLPLPVTEDDVEKEFWRLATNLMETVEVEYGADIHSTTHGSGFPTMEKQPRGEYTFDPWNLNVLPLDRESLFRFIKTDISGMTVPWLYVGMCFSTFCWHNEDHYAYSANYQHFGATKTWYAIPGEQAERFEDAMRQAVPELFESQPDLLFQLVTLLPPDQLKKAGVDVYAVDQRAGQFVVTYPQAYHAGFNHGFNFNEAVNFAPSDWEPFGQSGIERLRDFRRNPCFSHDLLLMTAAATKDLSIATAGWLAPALERAVNREKVIRQYFQDHSQDSVFTYSPVDFESKSEVRALKYVEILEAEDAHEDDYVCEYCKAYTYLSRWTSKKSKKVVCLDHIGHIDWPLEEEEYTMVLRYTTAELEQTAQKVKDRAMLPQAWTEKLRVATEDVPKPQLKTLRSLLTEGERIPWNLPQLPDLKKFVEKCNEWVEEAQGYITRKQSRRKSEKTSRKSGAAKAAEAEEKEKEFRKLSNIKRLLNDADHIGFECPEIQTLQERADTITDYQKKARHALATLLDQKSADLEELIEVGKSYALDIPEIDNLEKVLKQMQWRESARSTVPGRTLQEVEALIMQSADVNVPDYNEDLVFLKESKSRGEQWEAKAKELMAADQIHYAQLDSFAKQALDLPVNKETLAAVDAILKKQRETQELITSLLEKVRSPDISQRPRYKEVRDVMASLAALNSKPQGSVDLEKEQKRHEDWMRRGKKLFGKSNAPLHILQQHMETVESHNKACFNLTDQPRGPVEPQSREQTPEEGTQGHSSSSRDVFCLCRTPEAGLMIECITCHEWYHSKCLKIARGKVKEDDDFVCPVCDWRVKIPRDANRPKLEALMDWQAEINNLPFQPEEDESLSNIIENALAFREFLIPYTSQTAGMMSTMEEVPTQRFYLRKLEGADVLLAQESNFFRQSLHRLVPHAPEPPPLLEVSLSTRKPRPTKQQKLMAQLGVDNPDDLPEHLRPKTYNKKKSPSAEQKLQSTEPGGNGSMGIPQQDNNYPRPQHSTSYPNKAPQYQASDTSPDGPGNPFRHSATAAATLALGSPPPAFNNDLLPASPRRNAPLDYSNGLDLPTWDEDRNRQRYDAFAQGDGAPTSNFDEMFALTNGADDVHDGRNAGGNGDSAMDPALFM